ncbi:DUF5302 domain-containing protein [Microbacterium gorillae]|uniref:DUF5302 domain-containing protein n=1 Tax=Microbacterium gorillae TaxID=1231063 RepID=UPI000B0B4132|nr:DUF5302 domain-containing protein [Microbacterium gorillae]
MSEQNDAADDVKRKFREALEKKNAQHNGAGESHLDGKGAVTEAHGAAGAKRQFRRKSG